MEETLAPQRSPTDPGSALESQEIFRHRPLLTHPVGSALVWGLKMGAEGRGPQGCHVQSVLYVG